MPHRPPNATRRPARGGAFTLIETLAAVIVLAVAVPPMVWAVRDAAVGRVDPINASRARWLATERLEDVIADRHAPTRGYAYLVNANYPAEAAVSGFPAFARTTGIVETGAALTGGGAGYKTVTVTVSWTSPRAGARSLAVSTVVTDYTP